MSIPIQTNQTLSSLSGLFTTQSPQSSSGAQTSAFSQLVAALDQTGSRSAPAPGGNCNTAGMSPGSGQPTAAAQSLWQTLSQGIGTASAESEVTATAASSAQGGTGNAGSPTQASRHHHGHHHGGSSSWLTSLLNDNGAATSATNSVTGSDPTSSSSGTAAYAWQQLAQPVDASSAAIAARNLLAVG